MAKKEKEVVFDLGGLDIDLDAKTPSKKNQPQPQDIKNLILEIPLDKVKADLNQPRKFFDEKTLAEAAADIDNRGQLQPIIVSEPDMFGNYIIQDGERRFRAINLLGKPTIRAIIGKLDVYGQFAANEQRENFTFEEKALFIHSRIDAGDSQAVIAKQTGYSKGEVSKYVAWKNPPESLEMAHKAGIIDGLNLIYEMILLHKKEPEIIDSFFEEMISKKEQVTSVHLNDIKKNIESGISGKLNELPTHDEKPTLLEGLNESSDVANDGQGDSTSNDDDDDQVGKEEPHHATKTTKEPKEKDETKLSKPLILASFDDRECVIEYKHAPTTAGLIWVRYENGEVAEVPAGDIVLNSIIEG